MSIVKFLLNTAIAGAVAGGVYYYLDQNARKNAAMAEDPEESPRALDRENIKDAADRAYTSIVHGTEEMTESLKRSVGPQGEAIINDVQDAAGKVQETVTYAGRKVGGIVTDTDSTVEEKASAVMETVRYAALDLHEKFRTPANVAEPDEFEEEPEDGENEARQADAYVEHPDEEVVTEAAEADEEDDPEIEVEFYVDQDAAEEAEAAAVAEADAEGLTSVEVFVETGDEPGTAPETPAAEAAPATGAAETVAEPVTDAAQIEEFFDDEDAN